MKNHVKAILLQDRILCAHFCIHAGMTDAQMENAANECAPTGIGSRWRIIDPRDGSKRYITCADDSNRVHVVMEC